MILSLFLLLTLMKSLFLKSTAEEAEAILAQSELQVSELENQIARLEAELRQRNNRVSQLERLSSILRTQLRQRRSRVSQLEEEVERLKLAPPVVVIQGSGEYQFASGSAELPAGLREYIESELVARIEQVTQERDIYIVEIIGHTDGQVLGGASNLDQVLEQVARGRQPVNAISPGSNADLGLMRALEVVKELQRVQQSGRLQGLEFRAYSAAQLLLPSGDFAAINREPNPVRRRIEIRFSPLGKAETIK